MATTIVGLTGGAGSGKSTVATRMRNAHGYVNVKFADALKQMLRTFYATAGLSRKEIDRRIEGDLKETPCDLLCGNTPRYAMQTLGTEWGRKLMGYDLWVNLAEHRIKNTAGKVVVDDLRFDNEAVMLSRLGAKIALVDKKNPLREISGHVSEKGVSVEFIHTVIPNNGTVPQLNKTTDIAMEFIEND